MNIAFDIETIRNESMISQLPEPEVKLGNLKDPEKIEEKMAAAREDQISHMTLNPIWGRICCWATATDEKAEAHCIKENSDAEEAEIIELAFKTLGGHRVVTYNGTDFDLPFLYRRALVLGIDPRAYNMPTLQEITKRFDNKKHVDLMKAWCPFGSYEKLDNVARAIAHDHKIEIDFRQFPEMIKTKEGRKDIKLYNIQDSVLTLRIFNLAEGILF